MELWPLLALGFSFCGAVIVGYNHYARVDGSRLVVLRLAGVLPLAAMMAWLFPFPHDLGFYGVAAGMGVVLALADTILFDAAHRYGGRLAALYIPKKMLLGFALWGLIEPASVAVLWEVPWRGGLVAAGFGLCVYAFSHMRNHDASRAALLAVLPVAVLLAIGDVVAKYALPAPSGGMDAVIGSAAAFLTMTTSVGSVVGLVMGGRFVPTWREVAWSAGFGMVLMAGLCVFLVTLALAPNPGYVGAITMLSALWLALHGYWHHGERARVGSGLLLVAGALLVALGAA